MNSIFKACLFFRIGLLAMVVNFAAFGEPPAPGPCTGTSETGPHTLWWCKIPFSYNNPVNLSWTNGIFHLGDAIPKPTVVGPFASGEAIEYIYYDCDWNAYLDQTNYFYTASSTNWDPESIRFFPTNATAIGT